MTGYVPDNLPQPQTPPTFDWLVVRPLVQTNWVIDPAIAAQSLGLGSSWTMVAPASGANTVVGNFSKTYRGPYSIQVPGAVTTTSGDVAATQAVTIANGSDSAVASCWVYLTAAETEAVGIHAVVNGIVYTGTVNGALAGQWQRAYVALSATGITYTTATIGPYVAHTHATSGIIYFTAFQLENGTELSTYIDGDQDGCTWIGTPFLSPSVRGPNCRSGGVETSFSTYMRLTGMKGWGTPPSNHVTLPRGFQGGAVYQRSVRQQRTAAEIDGLKKANPDVDSIFNDLGGLQKLLAPDLAGRQAPVTLVFQPANAAGKQLETEALLQAGLEPYDAMTGLTVEPLNLTFTVPEPWLRERGDSAGTQNVSALGSSSIYYRPGTGEPGFSVIGSGDWQNLAGEYCGIWVDNQGTLECLIGGDGPIDVFSPASVGNASGGMSLIGTGAGPVNASGMSDPGAIAYCGCQPGPNSAYVYVGGNFPKFADGSGTVYAYPYLVRVNLATGAVDQPFGAPSIAVGDLAYDPTTDTLYVGSSKSGNLPYCIPSPNTASPSSTATPWGTWTLGADGCSSLAVADDGSLYGVSYTIATKTSYVHVGPAGAGSWGTVIGNFVSKTSAVASTMAWGPDGGLYLGSEFDSISLGGAVYGLARWTGATWSPLGGRVISSALSGTKVTNLAFDPQGRLHISGLIKQYGSQPAPLRAIAGNPEYGHAGYVVYSGNTMHAEGVVCASTYADLAHTPLVVVNPSDGSVVLCTNDDRATPHAFYAQPTVVTTTATAPTPLLMRLTWPSSASGPLVFGALRNERSGRGIYFRGLWLYPGETLSIDTTPGKARVYSDRRPDLSRYVASVSDLETMTLLPGANYITILDFANGNTGTAVCTLTWRNRHLSIEGSGSSLPTPNFSAL